MDTDRSESAGGEVLFRLMESLVTKVFDLMMLVVLGGRGRTEAELRCLLEAAGFQVNRVLPTSGAFAVVEAFPG
jgi:hypothetical protein